jgi:YggT family protein
MFLIGLVSDAIQLLTLLIIVRAVLSWFPNLDYGHPLIRFILRVTDPILVPLRRVIPPLGGIDLTPLVAILLVQFVGKLVLQLLYSVPYGF